MGPTLNADIAFFFDELVEIRVLDYSLGMRSVCFLLFMTVSTGIFAGFYKWVGPEGTVHYSDQPVEQAEELRLIGVGAPSASQPENSRKPTAGLMDSGYESVEILQPEPNQTLRTDSGEVNVGILIKPALLPDHTLHLTLDGNNFQDRLDTTQFTLSQVGRGSHSLSVSILDPDGNVVARSASVTFHVRRAQSKPIE